MSSGSGSYQTWSALSLAPQARSTEKRVPKTPASMLCPAILTDSPTSPATSALAATAGAATGGGVSSGCGR
eukprot:735190-Prymnesium_polylepis.1